MPRHPHHTQPCLLLETMVFALSAKNLSDERRVVHYAGKIGSIVVASYRTNAA